MTAYKGPAELLAESGRTFAAEADLTEDASGGWRGTLTFFAVDSRALWEVTHGHVVIAGRSGEIVRRSIADWGRSTGGPFVMDVVGRGPAPF
ncbi:hypothetical protein [Streptomyces sp. NPDC054887]